MRYSKTVTNEKEATTANLAVDSTVMAKTIVYTFFVPVIWILDQFGPHLMASSKNHCRYILKVS